MAKTMLILRGVRHGQVVIRLHLPYGRQHAHTVRDLGVI